MGRSTALTARTLTRPLSWVILGVAIAVATACTDPIKPNSIAGILCTPLQDSVEVGSTSTGLTFRGVDALGKEVPGLSFVFSSSAPDVATIDQSGVATGLKVGTTLISGAAQGRICTLQLRVIAKVASLVLTPSTTDVAVGASLQLTSSVFDGAGTAIAGRVVSWSTASAATALVSPLGVVTGVAQGTTTITAAVGNKTASSTIRVTPEPVQRVVITSHSGVVILRLTNTLQLTAAAYGAGPTPLVRTINWTSNNPAVAVVSNTGLVTTLAIGTANITAESDGKQAALLVQVTPVPVSRVDIVPSSLTMLRGANQQLAAIAKDSAGNVLSLLNRSVFWQSTNSTIASVNGAGVVSAFSPGTADVTVVVDGTVVSPALNVTVNDPPVVSVQVTPNTISLPAGQNILLSATARDVNQNVITGKSFTWATSNPGCATVTTNGLVQAVAANTCTITATVDGVTGSSAITVTVNNPAVVSVQVAPNTNTIKVGLTVLLSAVARDVNQNVIFGKTFTWTTSDAACATVTTNGLVAAIATGSCTITATVDGISGNSLITVIP